MKKLLTLLLIPVLSFCQVAIPDQNFENKLIQLGYDNIMDGQIGFHPFGTSLHALKSIRISSQIQSNYS